MPCQHQIWRWSALLFCTDVDIYHSSFNSLSFLSVYKFFPRGSSSLNLNSQSAGCHCLHVGGYPMTCVIAWCAPPQKCYDTLQRHRTRTLIDQLGSITFPPAHFQLVFFLLPQAFYVWDLVVTPKLDLYISCISPVTWIMNIPSL